MDRLSGAYDCLVIGIHHAVPVDILVFRISGTDGSLAYARHIRHTVFQGIPVELLRLVGSFIDIAVHHARRLAHLGDIRLLTVELLVP